MRAHFLTASFLALSIPIRAQDLRFRSYGQAKIAGYKFPYRDGGGSFDACASASANATSDHCAADFYTVGQLNDRTIGPYKGLDDGTVFKRFGFLRASRPPRYDCHIGLDLVVTNWFFTTRCIEQLGSDGYREVVQLLLGVKSGEEFKRDVLQKMFDAEKSMLAPFIRHYLDRNGNTATVVLEVGNEPNVHPAMDPGTYAWYFNLYATAARAAAVQVGKERGVTVNIKMMSAGLWIFSGMPGYLIDAFNQGVEVSIGRITLTEINIPTGFRWCGWWRLKYICGLHYRTFNPISGIDFKSKVYTDARTYFETFIRAAGAQNVDIAGLHLYPYVARDAGFGEGKMQPHLDLLNSFATRAASLVRSREVWLTEVGNFNPYGVDDTITKVVSPLLSGLKTKSVPAITRWYWFKNGGNDKKLSMIHKVDGTAAALSILGIQGLDLILGPLITIEKPKLSTLNTNSIVRFINEYAAHEPQQGLYNHKDLLDKEHLSPIGTIYHNFATIPNQGAVCDGSPGGFPTGCRGTGCSVCTEILVQYPKYFRNRPNCLQNPTCQGQFFLCNAACTEPMGFDA